MDSKTQENTSKIGQAVNREAGRIVPFRCNGDTLVVLLDDAKFFSKELLDLVGIKDFYAVKTVEEFDRFVAEPENIRKGRCYEYIPLIMKGKEIAYNGGKLERSRIPGISNYAIVFMDKDGEGSLWQPSIDELYKEVDIEM